MKKNYFFIYTVDDLAADNTDLTDLDDFFPDEDGVLRYVNSCLDRLSFEINNSVIERLAEIADKYR
jgi:hypothetical protein